MYCYSRNCGFQQKGLVLKRGENESSEKSELSDRKALRDPGQTWKSPTRALGQEGSLPSSRACESKAREEKGQKHYIICGSDDCRKNI